MQESRNEGTYWGLNYTTKIQNNAEVSELNQIGESNLDRV